jgi:PPE-repeat protein
MATKTIYPFGQSAEIGGTSYVIAWDGTATPVVGDIPAGVSVTYGGQTYTGTLPASSSTMGSIYLVAQSANPDVKDMYIVAVSGGNYAWTKIGSSSVDLSGYATEAWVEARDVDLTVAQYEALVNSGTVDPNKRYFVDEEQ